MDQMTINLATSGRATEADRQAFESYAAANRAASDDLPSGPQIKIGGQRFVFEGGQARMEATDFRHNIADNARLTETGLSIRDHVGRPVTSLKDAKDSDVVTLSGGMETTIANARRSGLLDGDGRLTNGAASEAPQQQQETSQASEAPALLDHSSETLLSNVTADTSAHTQLKALGEIATTGDLSEQTLAMAASEMGISSTEAAKVVGDLRAAFERQANAAVKNLGIQDVEGVWSWARTNAPDLLAEAISNQGRNRSTSGYQAIAQAYLAALPSIDANWVMEAQHGPGLSLSKTPDGKVVVNVQGQGSFEWSQAVRMGLIRVSGV